jgi:hypothetical protein
VSYEGTPRPMSNLLTPPGLVNWRHYDKDFDRRGIKAATAPMPAYLTWIKTSQAAAITGRTGHRPKRLKLT